MKNSDLTDSDVLRRQAEKKLCDDPAEEFAPRSLEETQRLLHELQIHQIELKLQNEELIASRAELEAALARYTDFYDFAPAGFLTLDQAGIIRQTNLPGARLLNCERARLIGRPLEAFVVQSDRARFGTCLQAIFKDAAPQTCTLNLIGQTRAPLPVHFEGMLSPDGDNVRAVLVDISKQERAAAEREKLQEQLFQSLKMDSVGQLAGGVAHDFNNILVAILGNAELALLEVEPEHPVVELLQEIRKSAELSAALVGQLLAFARRQTAAPRVIDLNRALDRTLNMVRRLIGEGIELVWRPGQAIWPVRMDPAQIDQILINLCINARDAMHDVGTLTVSTDNIRLDGGSSLEFPEAAGIVGEFAQLTVQDTGHGMTPETLDRVFEPFFTTKKLGTGTGLGLATVYGIVKQNQGIAGVSSVLGRSTTFRICLPRQMGEAAADQVKAAVSGAGGGHATILLVEDEPSVLHLTRRMLESLGYRVLATESPREAVSLAREHGDRIDLLLTDVVMPEMNGRDLAEQLLGCNPSLKQLFMSGYTANIIANHGVLDNGVHFIQKPFLLKDLARQVREALAEVGSD